MFVTWITVLKRTRTIFAKIAICGLMVMGMLSMPSVASAQTYRIETDNFLFVGDLDKHRAQKLVSDLEDYRSVLIQAFGLPYRREPIKVKIFYTASASQFAEITGRDGAGGLYVRKLSGPVFVLKGAERQADLSGVRRVAFHEFTHHLLASHYDGLLPMWYNEGLAEYYSSFSRRPDGTFAVGEVDVMNAALLTQFDWLSMRTVLSSVRDYPFDSGSMGGNGFSFVDFFYAQSWLAAHYFQSNADARKRLTQFLNSYDPSVDGEFAFHSAFGKYYHEFEGDLRAYLAKGKFTERVIRPRRTYRSRPARIRHISGPERALFVANLTRQIGSEGLDTFTLSRLYDHAARSGQTPSVLVGRASIANMKGDHASVNALLKAALRQAPYDPDILTEAGLMILKRHEGPIIMNREDVRYARTLLRRAITRAPNNMSAHYYYALSYVMLDETPSHQALMSARKSIKYSHSSEFTDQNFDLTPIFIHFKDMRQARKNIDRALVWSQSATVKRDARRLQSLTWSVSTRY